MSCLNAIKVKNKKRWIDLALLNLCTVAFLGMTLRSKILFSLPLINYNNLLQAHEHFAFGGWVTLALMVLMVYELLPESLYKKAGYQWLFGSIFLCSWCMLLNFSFSGLSSVANLFSTLFIVLTYFFSYIFLKDISKTAVSRTVRLLSVTGIVCMVLSSTGPFMLDYLFTSKSLNAILYRDALFTYLHLMYNGFFTLSVFALLFARLEPKITIGTKRNTYRFSVLLCLSILPSLFLSYLWHDADALLKAIALAGSLLLLLSFIWFIIFALPLIKIYRTMPSTLRYIGLLSMAAFMLKLILQSLTIFPAVGDAVFGDRPIIIGFLHLVFLAFVSLFTLAYLVQAGWLDIENKFTRIALAVFTLGVLLNEGFLMAQGLGAMFIKSSHLFPWLLWITSICLFIGALLIVIARAKTNAAAVLPALK